MELPAGDLLIEEIEVGRPADDKHPFDVWLQPEGELERAFHIYRKNYAGGVRDGAPFPFFNTEDERHTRKDFLSVPHYKFERGMALGDNHIQAPPCVLAAQEVLHRHLIFRCREAPEINVFSVIIEVSGQTVAEGLAKRPFNEDGIRRIFARRMDDQHLLLSLMVSLGRSLRHGRADTHKHT